MEELISIIVPVYKVEDYLRRSLDSLISQTYSNWEAILVVDGSPDLSGSICDEYSKADSRFRVIHKDNEGVAVARNTGLDSAKGKIIAFVDSDDFVHPDMLATQYKIMEKYACDLVITGYRFAYDSVINDYTVNGEPQVLDSRKAIEKILDNQQFCSPWTKLYKKSLFDNVRYPKGAIYEDLMTAFEIFMAADKIVYQDIDFYYYFQVSDSITRSEFHYKKLDEVVALRKQYEFIKKNFPDMEQRARLKYVDNVFGHMMNLVTKDDETGVAKYNEFAMIIKDNYEFYRKNASLSRKNAVRLRLMKHPKFYKKIYNITGKN